MGTHEQQQDDDPQLGIEGTAGMQWALDGRSVDLSASRLRALQDEARRLRELLSRIETRL